MTYGFWPFTSKLEEVNLTSSRSDDIYKQLGAKPIINAIGSVTMLGGSTPVPEVKEAMDQADVDVLAVTDGEGAFIGMLSADDILKLDEILEETGG